MSGRSAQYPLLSLLYVIFVADWQHKLRLALTGLLLLQFVEWFDEYWLLDTEWLVRGGMAAALLTEFFPRIRPFLRKFAAILFILLLHYIKLDVAFPAVSVHEGGSAFLSSLGHSLFIAFGETVPFIWFSMSAWLVYLVSVFWLKERARIMVCVVLSVILFALMDSYSKLVMWDQVAYIVFCGLGLIIIEHYEHFRSKHPASWSYLAEYPGKVALPIVFIVSLVMLAGSLAPNARPLLTDPYTIYKHWKGERVVTGGKGFSSIGSGSLAALNSSSGYGRSDEVLGGGFDYDYAEVIRITTSQRSYWRGETKSLYTGQGWISSDADRDAETVPVTAGGELAEFDWGTDLAARTVEVIQTVRMTEDPDSPDFPDYPVLFGASPIRSLQLSMPQIGGETAERENVQAESGPVIPDAAWSPRQGELRWDGAQPYPMSYELVSALPVTDVSAWKSVKEQSFEGGVWADYLQLPDSLPDRVRKLAADIASDAATPYDKVKSIESYLQANYKYNNRPDIGKGKSEDFVDRFLFEIREGYCDYFSSAMAVMVRSIGLPTRWVKGFKPGVSELEEAYRGGGIPPEALEELSASGEGTYIVRNSDAHSWVEVFFPGYGWLPFEPTSGMALPVVQSPDEAAAVQAEVSEDPTVAGSGEKSVSERLLSPVFLTVVVVLGALTAVAWRFDWHRKLFGRRKRMKEERTLDQQALLEIGKLFKLFGRKGYLRGEHETARESFSRWTGQNKWLKKDLDFLLAVLEKAKYSPHGVTPGEISAIFKIKLRIKEEL